MPPPNERSVEDAFWSLVLAAARNRAHAEYVERRLEDRPERSLIMDPYGMPRVRHEDAAQVEIRLMTLDTHVIPARAARDEIGRILGYVSSRPPVDTRAMVPAGFPSSDPPPLPTTAAETIAILETVAQQATEAVRATLPSPIPSPPPPAPPVPEPPPDSDPEDGASVRYSLMELD